MEKLLAEREFSRTLAATINTAVAMDSIVYRLRVLLDHPAFDRIADSKFACLWQALNLARAVRNLTVWSSVVLAEERRLHQRGAWRLRPLPLEEDTFPRFSSLPVELQNRIWTMAAHPPPHRGYLASLCLLPDAIAMAPGEWARWARIGAAQQRALMKEEAIWRGAHWRWNVLPLPVFHGRQPASAALGDAGLWSACRASRAAVRRAYQQYISWFHDDPDARPPQTPADDGLRYAPLRRRLTTLEDGYYLKLAWWNTSVCSLARALDRSRSLLAANSWFVFEAWVRRTWGQDNLFTALFKTLYGIPPGVAVEGDHPFDHLPLPGEVLARTLRQCRPWPLQADSSVLSGHTPGGSAEDPVLVSDGSDAVHE